MATWAPLRARRRKRDVPTNSPVVAWGGDVSFDGRRWEGIGGWWVVIGSR